jgi:hypothetical protein
MGPPRRACGRLRCLGNFRHVQEPVSNSGGHNIRVHAQRNRSMCRRRLRYTRRYRCSPPPRPRAQCRRRPAEALGGRRAHRRRAFILVSGGSGKWPQPIPRGESRLCDPRIVTPPPSHLCAWQMSPKRIPTRRGTERSERMSEGRFPASRSGPRTDCAGAAQKRLRALPSRVLCNGSALPAGPRAEA